MKFLFEDLPHLWTINGFPLPKDANSSIDLAKRSHLAWSGYVTKYINACHETIAWHEKNVGKLPRHQGQYHLVFVYTVRNMRKDVSNVIQNKALIDSLIRECNNPKLKFPKLLLEDSPRFKPLKEECHVRVIRDPDVLPHVQVSCFDLGSEPIKTGKLVTDNNFVHEVDKHLAIKLPLTERLIDGEYLNGPVSSTDFNAKRKSRGKSTKKAASPGRSRKRRART